jgi:general secretion pathway protein K
MRSGRDTTPRTAQRPARGVALVNALLVVAALAAISVALLARAERSVERIALRVGSDQLGAYLDAGQAQALSDLARTLAARGDPTVQFGQGWDLPRDVVIDRGRVAWMFDDLQGRFNLAWLADEGAWGDLARAAFLRLAQERGIPDALAQSLMRAAGSDDIARATAMGTARPPPLPLSLPQQLAIVPRASEGGAGVLAPLLPYLAALPTGTGLNVATAPLPVLQALIPGLHAHDWEAFAQARAAGLIVDAETLLQHAQDWPEGVLALLPALPITPGSDWFELRLTARLDTLAQGRSAVVSLTDPEGGGLAAPRIVLSLPIVP